MTQRVRFKVTAWPRWVVTKGSRLRRDSDLWEFHIVEEREGKEIPVLGPVLFRCEEDSAFAMDARETAAIWIQQIWADPEYSDTLKKVKKPRPTRQFKWDPLLGPTPLGPQGGMVGFLYPKKIWAAKGWDPAVALEAQEPTRLPFPSLEEAVPGLHYFEVSLKRHGPKIQRQFNLIVTELVYHHTGPTGIFAHVERLWDGSTIRLPKVIEDGGCITAEAKARMMKRAGAGCRWGWDLSGIIRAIPPDGYVWHPGAREWRAAVHGLEQYQEDSRIGFRKPRGTLPHPLTEKIDTVTESVSQTAS